MAKLKRFKCFILNDRDSDTGWYSFISSFLLNKHYLERCSLESVCDGKSIEFTIYSPQSPTHPGSTLPQALHHLRTRSRDYDLFVIDLDLNDGSFIDENEFLKEPSIPELSDELSQRLTDSEEEVLRVHRQLTHCKQNNLKPGFYAGLECFTELEYSDSIKVVFSGSHQTRQLFEYVNILKNVFSRRLSDIIFYRDNEGDVCEEDKGSVEKLLDFYLFKKQVKIIERQDLPLRQILHDELKFNKWDDPLIPDNGSRENHEECWSLRSLFPKQVNSITKSLNEINSREHILAILDSDWRRQFKELVNHPYKDGDERKCALITNILKALEFEVASAKAFNYQKTTDYAAFSASTSVASLNQLRDQIISKNVKFFTDNIFVCDRARGAFRKMPPNYWQSHLSSYAVNFGIYPADLKYLAQIVNHNKRHLLDNKTIDGIDIGLEVRDDSTEQGDIATQLTFVWYYSKQSPPEKLSNPKLSEKFSHASQNPYILEDGGMADAIRIACFRYRGILELETGTTRLTISRSEFRYTLIEPDTLTNDGTTQLRVTISKPYSYL